MKFQYTEISDDENQVYWIFQSFSERGPKTRVMVWIFPTTVFFRFQWSDSRLKRWILRLRF